MKKGRRKPSFSLAQRVGFEPTDTFLHHTISNRARSTTPPSLHSLFIIYHSYKNCKCFRDCFYKKRSDFDKKSLRFIFFV